MKNNDEMYRSVLSRREEYRKKKEKQIHTVRRTLPLLACFCFTVVFIPMLWDNLERLPDVPIHTDIVDETTIESSEIAAAADTDESGCADQAISADAVSTTIPNQNTKSDISAMTEKNQTQTITTAVPNNKSDRETEQKTAEHKETQAPVTTAPVVKTKPTTQIQTKLPILTTAETPKTIVNEPKPIITQITKLPDIVTDEPVYSPVPQVTTKASDIDQEPVYSPVPPVTTKASDSAQEPVYSDVLTVTTKFPDIVYEPVDCSPVTTQTTAPPDFNQGESTSPVQTVTAETSKSPDIVQDVQKLVVAIPFDDITTAACAVHNRTVSEIITNDGRFAQVLLYDILTHISEAACLEEQVHILILSNTNPQSTC